MNGLLVVNKQKGYTSRDVVNIVGKTLGTKKVGHTGTLDPIAEGVLVCVIGKYTKLCDVLVSEEKEYIATMQFGILTDTLDNTGKVLERCEKQITINDVKKAFENFKGEYKQTVPIYSAVKLDGKKLYEYARDNIEIELPTRKVNIKELEIIDFKDNILTFKTLVSKGTFIRSLVRDIGEYLETYGTMTQLTRTKQGNFLIENSYTIDEIKKGNYRLVDLKDIFKDYPLIEVDSNMYEKIIHGQEFANDFNKDFILYSYNNEIVAVYQISKKDNKKIKPLILVWFFK